MSEIGNIIIGGMQEHQSVKTDGICTCLTSAMGMGGGYIPMTIQIRKVDKMYAKNTIARAEQSRAEQSRAEQLDCCVNQLGNCMETGSRQNPNQGRVYDSNYLSPTLTDMQGGGRQPHILEVKKMEQQIVRMIGRDKDNPSDRSTGNQNLEQVLEPNAQGISNTISSVHKDNLVLRIENSVDPDFHNFLYEIDGEVYLIRIRKLIPKECIKLMDVPEKYIERMLQVESNTNLYKASGNSIVCNCLVSIFGQMFEGKENVYKGM